MGVSSMLQAAAAVASRSLEEAAGSAVTRPIRALTASAIKSLGWVSWNSLSSWGTACLREFPEPNGYRVVTGG